LSRDGDNIHVETSAAVRIALTTNGRRSKQITGEQLSEADFTLNPSDRYFRITVTDEKGHRANTRAYFL
ncbi:MAG: hypothetical protein MJ118_03740, partial [Clostridia bacterium]|nr:hypothetical protein [Clostridia bacterium]